ncbi:MAG: serine hydrolase domain-containing protein [Candidatus Izemoplasmatales bacterium]
MKKGVEDFKNLLNKHFLKNQTSKLSFGIRVGEEIDIYNLNLDNDSESFLYGLGSVSKTILSTYIAYMVRAGKIDLEKKVDEYLSLNSRISYPKIIDLLTHTSGYHAFIPLASSLRVLTTKGFNKRNIYHDLDKEWFLKTLNKIKPFKKYKYRYSGFNYAIIAEVIEAIEKRPYKEVINDFLKNEVKISNTFYGDFQTTIKDPYSWNLEDDNPFLASGGMFSTVSDMIKFLDYQIVNKDYLAIAHKKYYRTNINKQVCTSFSWNAYQNGQFYWHIGGQGYYRSYVLFDLKKDISITVLSTVDIDLHHVNRIGSCLYHNLKKNNMQVREFLKEYSNEY